MRIRVLALGAALVLVAMFAFTGQVDRLSDFPSAVGAVLGLAGGSSTTAHAQDNQPTARPDLGLKLSDLPPGYEEGESLDLAVFGVAVEDRVYRRLEPGSGPAWIWTSTYEAANPLTQARVTFLARDLAIYLTRSAADVAQLQNWAEEPGEGLGDVVQAYSFTFRPLASDTTGTGALAVFANGSFLSYLVVLDLDEGAVADLGYLADIVNARIDSDGSAS